MRRLVEGPALIFRRRDVGYVAGGFHTYRVRVFRWVDPRRAVPRAGLWSAAEMEKIVHEMGRVGA